MDDFHCVLDDSEAGLKTADHSLKKIRKNPMDTGLAEKPGIYVRIKYWKQIESKCQP